MMRVYENLFIVKPDATEEEIDALIEQMSGNITKTGGTVDKVDKWGKRRLAYRVEKNREGFYVLLQFTAEANAVKEVERRLRVQDAVIKFMTVRIDETQKRIDKRKKEREKRAHRRPQPPAPQPSLAAQMMGGAGEGAAHPIPGAPAPAMPAAPAPAAPLPATPVAVAEAPVVAPAHPAPGAPVTPETTE
ncbi:MAG: ribosomal protein [Bryobacterales bacterium]|jgi:small subunit ribosomal protein S6|nr:ribosomal protein [Bryobacterales bacterium]